MDAGTSEEDKKGKQSNCGMKISNQQLPKTVSQEIQPESGIMLHQISKMIIPCKVPYQSLLQATVAQNTHIFDPT